MTKLKSVSTILILLIFNNQLQAINSELKFNENGKFKIVQFTDTHFKYGSEKSAVVLEMINEVLDLEKPDLVIFTGDIVTAEPTGMGWRAVSKPMVDRNIPWAIALGNHDDEHEVSRDKLLPLLQDIPFNYSQIGLEKVYGYGNYVLPIKSNNSAEAASLIYIIDSNAYPTIEDIGSYGWFQRSQVEWYVETSEYWKKESGGSTLPALAFFHIPLPEYHEVWKKGDVKAVGVKKEKVCSPVINTGMFAEMLHQGDVMGTFVGHDHVNDYISSLHGIALAYGRFSGGKTT